MAEVVLFHHVQGLTDGVQDFAERLRAGGHTVHAPDLFDGVRPPSIQEGIAHAQSLGDELDAHVDRIVVDLPAELVYAGKEQDPFFALEGDIDSAGRLVETIGPDLGALFVYPGNQHLFTDSSLPSFDPDATSLVIQRSREFLDRLG